MFSGTESALLIIWSHHELFKDAFPDQVEDRLQQEDELCKNVTCGATRWAPPTTQSNPHGNIVDINAKHFDL